MDLSEEKLAFKVVIYLGKTRFERFEKRRATRRIRRRGEYGRMLLEEILDRLHAEEQEPAPEERKRR